MSTPDETRENAGAAREKTYSLAELPALFMAAVPIAVLYAYVLTLGWRWFVQPVFASAPALGMRAAIGLMVFRAILSGGGGKTKYEPVIQWARDQTVRVAILLLISVLAHALLGGPW